MRIVKIIKLVFIISLLSLCSQAMDMPEVGRQPVVQKINEMMFVAQIQEDLFFVMEKLDETNIPYWQEYANYRYNDVSTLLKDEIKKLIFKLSIDRTSSLEDISYDKTRRYDTYTDYNNNPYHKKINPLLYGDSGAFDAALNNYVLRQKQCPTNETWIAYALSTRNAPTARCSHETLQHIEVCFTVNTDEEAPFTTHMGIQRSLIYMKNHLEEELRLYRNSSNAIPQFAWHNRISTTLHQFAMKVISQRDPKKLYMITVPMPEMRNMLLKALPTEAIWLGSDIYHQKLQANNDLKFKFWSQHWQKRTQEIELFGSCFDKILEKQYSPISYTGEYFVNERGGQPKTWQTKGIPEDFTWTLHDLHGQRILHFNAASLEAIMEKYQWIFMEYFILPNGMGSPYVIVDLVKGSQEFSAN